MKSTEAFGPASLGNLAAGFDTLGAALRPLDGSALGDTVRVRPAAVPSFRCDGPFAHQLPSVAEANLATAAARSFERAWGRALPSFALHLHKGLPVGSGLGSSSATVVATLRALNLAFDHPLDDAALLRCAGEVEGGSTGAVHLDNVAPALLGGLRLVTPEGTAEALPWPEDLHFVLASPDFSLTTRVARAALPALVPLSLAVAHGRNLAALVHALHAGERGLIRATLVDLLAEPHRAELVPGLRSIQRAAREAGAWACSLSGAGPALFAVAEAPRFDAVADAMESAWTALGIGVTVRRCTLDAVGAQAREAVWGS
jgi:homoserine kinase